MPVLENGQQANAPPPALPRCERPTYRRTTRRNGTLLNNAIPGVATAAGPSGFDSGLPVFVLTAVASGALARVPTKLLLIYQSPPWNDTHAKTGHGAGDHRSASRVAFRRAATVAKGTGHPTQPSCCCGIWLGHQVQGRLLLDVVLAEGPLVVQFHAGEYHLLIWMSVAEGGWAKGGEWKKGGLMGQIGNGRKGVGQHVVGVVRKGWTRGGRREEGCGAGGRQRFPTRRQSEQPLLRLEGGGEMQDTKMAKARTLMRPAGIPSDSSTISLIVCGRKDRQSVGDDGDGV